MKPNDFLKIIDSGSIEKIRIYYCGGHIDVEIPFAPFELPDYEIAKIGLYENGNGITLLLADNVTKFEMPDVMPKEETASKKRRTAEMDAKKAFDALSDYCDSQESCQNRYFLKNGCCNIAFITKDIIAGIPDESEMKKGGKE